LFTSEHSITLRCFTAISVLLARVILPSHDLPFVPLSNSGPSQSWRLSGRAFKCSSVLASFQPVAEKAAPEKGPKQTHFFVTIQPALHTPQS